MSAYCQQGALAYFRYMMHKFLADSMVGDVARNMRILGYDTEYYSDMTQVDTLHYAITTGRIILTKNQKLCRYARDVCIIYAATTHDIMKKVIAVFNISTDIMVDKTRCTICNGEQRKFDDKKMQCTSCNKIYWDGTHVVHMRHTAERWA